MFSFIIFAFDVWTHDQYIITLLWFYYSGVVPVGDSYTRLVKLLRIYRPNTSCCRIFQGLVDLLALCYRDICSGLRGKEPGGKETKKLERERERGRQRNRARVSSTPSANHLSPRHIFYVVRITDENAYTGSQAQTHFIPEIDFTYAATHCRYIPFV